MKTGVFQMAGGGLSPDERLARLDGALTGTGLDLVLCPELFLSGYDVGGAIHDRAEPVDGPFRERMAALARNHGTVIVYGYPERAGDTVYNSALALGPDGATLANHRKLAIPPGFESRYFAQGEGLTFFEIGGLRCAILICYDVEFPETVRAAAEAGAQVVLVPTALVEVWPVVAHRLVPARAFENGVWLLYANHAGKEGASNYLGASCIVAPDGKDAVRAGAGEALIVADVDAARVTAAQERLPYLRKVADLRRRLHGG